MWFTILAVGVFCQGRCLTKDKVFVVRPVQGSGEVNRVLSGVFAGEGQRTRIENFRVNMANVVKRRLVPKIEVAAMVLGSVPVTLPFPLEERARQQISGLSGTLQFLDYFAGMVRKVPALQGETLTDS